MFSNKLSRCHSSPTRRSKQTPFEMIFLTVAIGTATCIVLAMSIVIFLPVLSTNQQKVLDALLAGFTLGMGTIFGLLNGRSAG